MKVHYLEVVTHEVDATCANFEQTHGVAFSASDQRLGNARTASITGGGMIGVRAPLHESESPVVRPYMLVANINQSLAKAQEAGAEIAHPPLEIPGLGTFAIYTLGGIQHGLWQN